MGGKTYIHHKPSGREPSRWSRSWEQEPEPRGGAELVTLLLKRNIPRPSGLVFQRLLAEAAEDTPAASVFLLTLDISHGTLQRKKK